MSTVEFNFDAIVGPTHNYAGLAHGNLASQRHGQSVSHPRAAALEGLGKMKLLADLGVRQAVLPPQERPDVEALRRVGFSGSDGEVLRAAHRADPALLAACCSASGMWAANAATVSASADTADGRVHFTPANLISQFHRSLETGAAAAALKSIFREAKHFVHHDPLPAASLFSDEGAANHTRLAGRHGAAGIELFVYGRSALEPAESAPRKYPARQTREASAAVARLHGLRDSARLLIQQNPAAIDAGAFHNDVIAVGHLNVLLCHEMAFAESERTIELIREAFARQCGSELIVIQVGEKQLPLEEAVGTYLFNSQVVSLPDGSMALIAPRECAESKRARLLIDEILAGENPIRSVHYVDIRQSMRNGGGPACLRLRVPLTEEEAAAVHPGVMLTPRLYGRLVEWVKRHYREALAPGDLGDPQLLEESRGAMEELSEVLGLRWLDPSQA